MKFNLILFLLLCSAFTGFAQKIDLSGIVTSAKDNMPIPGVTIMVKGTTKGTITDFDGKYKLNVEKGTTLLFSFVGMLPQEVVANQSTINVKMNDAISDIDEVVVVGYGVQKKALVTGANVNIKGEKIAQLNTGTAMEALQGVTPGVSISRNSGAPGSGTQVSIRGIGTIGNASPLYIVDGIAVDDIDYLSSSDIASIDVLKDAASAAIYGSRAANGVVLVTTTKAKKGSKPRVTYDAYYGVQNVYKNVAPLNAQEYMYIMDEGRANDGLAPHNWEQELKSNNWLNNNYPNNLGTTLGEDVWGRLQNGWKGTNWIDEMNKKNAPIQNHAINITGASEDITYALGFSYFDQTGIVGGDITDAGYTRMTGRINTQMVLFKNEAHSIVTIGENFTYTNVKNRAVGTGSIYDNDLHNAIVQNPLMPAYWDKSPDRNNYTPTLEGVDNSQTNPLAVLYYKKNYNWEKKNTIVGNVFVEVEPIKDLKLRSSFGINSWFGNNRSWSPTYQLGILYNNTVDAASQELYQGVNYTWTNTMTYDFKIDKHKVQLLAGSEMLKNHLNVNVGGRKSNTTFGKPEYAYLDNVKKDKITGIDTWGRDGAAQGGALLSYMGRVSYNYNEKYILDATFRADGSSNFAEGNRWGFFPSFSAGWNFTQEEFLQDIPLMTYGKLRASWGQNGNQSIDNFIYSSNISYIDPGYYFGANKPISGSTAIPANVPNPDVTWETSEQLNIGVDTRWLDSKLSLTFDWYKKTTKDWLVIAPIQGTAGASAPYINGGNIENSGVELAIGWNDSVGEFKYGVTLSGSYNKNKVTKLDNAEGIITGPSNVLSQGTSYVSRVEVGKPIGFFYGYKTNGILQNQDEVDQYVGPEGKPYFEDQRMGDVRFVDQNNDGTIDEKDKVMLGDPRPDYELGIQLNGEYKGFYTNMTLTGKFGMQVMQSYRSFADKFDQNYTTEVFDRWHGEGTSNRLPRLSSSSHRNTNFISDIFMHDADYIRISNLTVGYDFKKMLKKVSWMSGAKLYMSVNNLYTFTGYKGMDPEVSYGHDAGWASGIDLGLYPLPRTVMLGLNISF